MNERRSTAYREQGMTIVEIMIGLLLSLVLSAGVIQIYLSNKQTYYLQDEMSRLQENGRFAIEVLQRTIRSAGIPGGQAILDVNTLDGVGPPTPYVPPNGLIQTGANDQIELVRMGWTDCTGTRVSVPPADPVQITEFFYIDANNNLACFNGGIVALLIENVETMEILYGIDQDGDRNADLYRSATQVAQAATWSQIVSVRIGLVFGSSPEASRGRMVPQPMAFPAVASHPLLSAFQIANGYPLLFDGPDNDRTPDTHIAPDTRLYRVFTTTIALRNRVP